MENYIGKCLDSLIIPEFDQVEVWVVNDGSKDNSSEIAHDYARRYPRSIKVLDKENGNYGSCINAALPLCSGRYVKILDADDTFDNKAFSEFVNRLNEMDVDVIFTKCREIDDRHKIIGNSGNFKNINYDVVYENINIYLSNNTLMHWITYNRSIFQLFDYHQPEGISYTDNIWAFIPIIFCKTGIFLDIVLYNYLIGREGQTISSDQLQKRIPHLLFVAQSMVDYHINLNTRKDLANITTRNCVAVITCIYNIIMRYRSKTNFELLKDFDQSIKHIAPDLYDAIGNYNIHHGINYKIYMELRKSDYDLNFKIPFIIKKRKNLKLHLHAINLKLKQLFY